MQRWLKYLSLAGVLLVVNVLLVTVTPAKAPADTIVYRRACEGCMAPAPSCPLCSSGICWSCGEMCCGWFGCSCPPE